MIKTLYLLSGMGADDEIYKFLDLGNIQTRFIPWQPVRSEERFTEYVHRLSREIDPSEEFGICGVSLGGIAAQEMTRYLNPKCLILISTIKNRNELPPVMRFAASAKLAKIIPEQFYKWVALHSGSILGVENSEEDFLFRQMINRFGQEYYKYCIKAVSEWDGVDLQIPYLHIHGDKDLVFPHQFVRNHKLIKGGTHLMMMNKADEISSLITNYLQRVAEQEGIK